MMKSTLMLLTLPSLLLFSMLLHASYGYVVVEDSLGMECSPVRGHQDQICAIITDGLHGPYDDLVLYHKGKQGNLRFLGSHKDGFAKFNGLGFSDGGKYMWVSWAEEGHPYFSIYTTEYFLSDGLDAEEIETVSDYNFEQIESFTDSGVFTYSQNEACYSNIETPCLVDIDFTKQINK